MFLSACVINDSHGLVFVSIFGTNEQDECVFTHVIIIDSSTCVYLSRFTCREVDKNIVMGLHSWIISLCKQT